MRDEKDLRGHFGRNLNFGRRSFSQSVKLGKLASLGVSAPKLFNRSKFGHNSAFDLKSKNERDPKQLRLLICTSNLGNAEPSKESMAAWIPEKGNMDSVVYESAFDVGFDKKIAKRGRGHDDEDEKRYGHFDIIVIGMQESTFSCESSRESSRGISRQQSDLSNDAANNINNEVRTSLRRGSQDSLFDDVFDDEDENQEMDVFDDEDEIQEMDVLFDKEEKKEDVNKEQQEKEEMEDQRKGEEEEKDEQEVRDRKQKNENEVSILSTVFENNSEDKVPTFAPEGTATGKSEILISELMINESVELDEGRDEIVTSVSNDFEGLELDESNFIFEEIKSDLSLLSNEMKPQSKKMVSFREDHDVASIADSGFSDDESEGSKVHSCQNIRRGFRASFNKALFKKERPIKKVEKRTRDVSYVEDNERKRSEMKENTNRLDHYISTQLMRKSLSRSGSFSKLMKRSSVSTLFSTVSLAVRSSMGSENNVSVHGGKYKNTISSKKKDTQVLSQLVGDRCPNHVFVVNYLHGAIRLMILVKKKLAKELHDVECKAVSTGIASVLRNKGGVVASFTLRETRLAFISAHLAAHEGQNYYNQRNQNIASILNGGKAGKYDASISNHHCFLLGDLNYRLKYPAELNEKMLVVKKAVDLVKDEKWHDLNDMDELHKGLKNEEVLVGFKTPLCLFPPTFKVQRASGYHYLSQRSPSYTDRILWKSSQGLDSCVHPLVYEPVENYNDSDHKPIRSAFYLTTLTEQQSILSRLSRLSEIKSVFTCWCQTFKSRRRSSLGSRSSLGRRSSFFSSFMGGQIGRLCIDISGVNFYPSEFPKTSSISTKKKPTTSFYLMLDSNSVFLTSRNSNSSKNSQMVSVTKPLSLSCRVKKTDYITWGDEKIELTVLEDSDMTGALIFINLMSKMLIRENDVLIGTVALNLETLCKSAQRSFTEKNHAIDEQVLKNGQIQGRLICNIKVFDEFLEDFQIE